MENVEVQKMRPEDTTRRFGVFRALRDFFWVLSVVGIRQISRLNQARRWGWEGVIRGHFTTRAVQALLSLGLFDELTGNEAVDVGAFSRRNDLDESVVSRLCDALYARRILKKTPQGLFALDNLGRRIAESDLLRGWFELTAGYEAVLSNLERLARKEISYGDGVHRDGELVAKGSGSASRPLYFPLAMNILAQNHVTRVLDVGCGDGTFLRQICRRSSEIEGIGLDSSPDAIQAGKIALDTAGMPKRIALHLGDAFQIGSLAPRFGRVDAVTFFFVLHEFVHENNTSRAVELMSAFRETYPGAMVIVLESIRPPVEELRRRPGPAIEYYLLHDLSHQFPLGREAWTAIFQIAGFASIEERYLRFINTSIFVCR